jgi:hypothetical protein
VRVVVVSVLVLAAACGRVGFPAISAIGCADGTREGFTDLVAFPRIAACGATWTGKLDLRAPVTGAACGNSLGPCAALADACAPDWHPCTDSGDVTELQAIGPGACHASFSGRYAAASSHDATSSPCTYPAAGQWPCKQGTLPGSEAICCGTSCPIAGCASGVWPGATYNTSSTAISGCADLSTVDADGILCCRDE